MITVCGEGLVDLVPIHSSTNTNPRLLPLTPALGGGPFNVAITAARQGEPTQFLSRVSTDNFGDALVDRLTSENVDTSLVQRGQEPTTLAVTSLNPDGSASYSFYIDGTADRLVDPPADLTTDIACFGTVSLALEPGASRYAALLKICTATAHSLPSTPTFGPSTPPRPTAISCTPSSPPSTCSSFPTRKKSSSTSPKPPSR